MMPVIIIGGIRFGLMTDTEAAAVAAVYALAVSLLIYRDFKVGSLPQVLAATGRSTALMSFSRLQSCFHRSRPGCRHRFIEASPRSAQDRAGSSPLGAFFLWRPDLAKEREQQ